MEILAADLDDPRDADAVLAMLASYSEDPMGGDRPLADDVRETLIDRLKRHPTTEILLAWEFEAELEAEGPVPVGVAVCFVGFSTFRARSLLNVHDLAVVPHRRGRGIGRRLLEAAEDRARALGCCKLTLEVLERNERARGLYASFGLADFAPGAEQARTLFLEKPLPDES